MKPYRESNEPQTESRWLAWRRRNRPRLPHAFIVLAYVFTFAIVTSIDISPGYSADAGTETAVVATADGETAAPETAPATAAGLPDTSKLVATSSATADGPVGPDAGVAETLNVVIQLLKAKEWKLGIAALLMLLLAATKQWWSFVPKAWKPHFVAATSGLSVVASGMLAGMPVVEALWAGATVASFTGWLYGLVKGLLKKFIPAMKDKPVEGSGAS